MNTSKTLIFLFLANVLVFLLGDLIGGGLGIYIAILLLAFLDIMILFFSDRTILYQFQAKVMEGHTLNEIKPLVQALVSKAGIAMPSLYLIDDAVPNALVVQSLRKTGDIAVTAGLIDDLTREELNAVLAHCVARLVNHDAFMTTAVAVLAGGF